MYFPDHSKETDPQRILERVQADPFGLLVTVSEGMPFAGYLPFIFDPAAAAKGCLRSHMARANSQWLHFTSGADVLVVFEGPHAYISPSWYGSPGVPTLNYAAVQMRGKPRLLEDRDEVECLLLQQTSHYESRMTPPWRYDLEGDRRNRLLDAIVGFEIEVHDLQAKFKLSQNRSAEDRRNVIDKLNRSSDPRDAAIAELMSKVIPAGR